MPESKGADNLKPQKRENMPIYVVMYFEEYVGNHFDDYTRYFFDKSAAIRYANQLNMDLAEANHCEVKYLGDYYEVLEIEKGE